MPYIKHKNHRLFYREAGTGPLMLILPGNTATSACMQGEVAYFGERFHTIAMDFWGTGQSDRLATWPDDWFQQAAHDAAALIRHLGGPAIVVGTSGGADVALWMAVLYPDLITAVIADSNIEVFPPDQLKAGIREREARTPGQIGFWQFAHGENWEQPVDADSDMLRRLADRGGRLVVEALEVIKCPVLFSATLDDESLPDVAVQVPAMAQRIPDARVYLSKGGSHPLMWSKPEEFRTIADLFLKQID
jgi:valacyclovir hydrolase